MQKAILKFPFFIFLLMQILNFNTQVFGESLCSDPVLSPHLLVTTSAGDFTIELFEDAAPGAVHRLVELVEEPIFNPELTDAPAGSRAPGFFDGLIFDYCNPNIEVTTSIRRPARLFKVQTEIDASALGLDKDLVADAGAAMDIMQFELAKERDKRKKKGGIDGTLAEWFEKLHQSGNAEFLVGTSRQEINEALGFSYTDGLNSRPATRSMVALKPVSPQTSEARLSFFLSDFPQRTGRWMVIGRIVEGLKIVDAISKNPLLGPPGWRNRGYTPRNPIVIESIRFSCQ